MKIGAVSDSITMGCN